MTDEGASLLRVHGLDVASELELAGLPPARSGAVPAVALTMADSSDDLIAGRAVTLSCVAQAGSPRCTVYRDDEAAVIHFDEVLTVAVDLAGDRLTVAPDRDADPDVLTDLLLGLPFAYVLWRRGILPLHASAVAFGERAVALAAPSLTGKSTLATACLDRGALLLADDLVALHPRPVPVHISPGLPTLRLSERSAAAVGRGAAPLLRPTRPGWKHWQHADPAPAGEYALSALALLERRPAEAPTAARVSPAEALVKVGAQLYGFTMFTREERRAALQSLAAVVAAVPVVSLAIPDDIQRVAAAAELVEQLAMEGPDGA